ncbi:hypothetical protein [Actinoplanes sp. L3-i22]|uniref:hypothetical protein n=1 Tax=Actinoplanes sp. L3-i22 TaxID=2836373 RepID=UPI001C754729|nr:hypothetical protein [Actinoplanes sp. L3-i22]BCY09113.1 hypothetical protein L3i22_042010 [Actinoplanes sp. L3-i22]
MPHRLRQLLSTMERLLAEKYAFHVFAANSINFGFQVTYRQTWVPHSYQVGDLVSTIPLAPKEVRRYTTKRVTKKTRTVKELEDNLQTRKTDRSDTARADAEIVDKAHQKTNFTLTANESFGGQGWTANTTQTVGGDQGKESERVKKEFRESVVKSAQEYRQQHRTEIDTSAVDENEETGFHEIQNPNDELTVTYLFYELQRTYRISERIHQLTPVILVANEVPAPHEIDDAWLLQHDWILRRVVLDDSFRPALRYLTESFVGAETNIRILENNALGQKQITDSLRQQVRRQAGILSADEADVLSAVRAVADGKREEGLLTTVKRVFDPLGITGGADTGKVSAAEAMVDYAKEARDRADRERDRLASQLEVATTALQAAVDRLSAAVREHYDKVAEIDRLRLHVKENILYYMQAIWDHEPPDQRFLRLYNVDVPFLEVAEAAAVPVSLRTVRSILDVLRGDRSAQATIPMPPATVTVKKLVEVAELDTLLGYKGNYSIFPLKENNQITLHMMQDYLKVGEELLLHDPDELADYTVEDLQRLASCLYRRSPALFEKHREEFKQLLIDRLSSARKDDDLVVVPTSALYIEALTGTHPLLEDFKLIHRALDVKKVQAEVRHAELENVRLAARALKGKDEDPDIDRKIVITDADADVTIADT